MKKYELVLMVDPSRKETDCKSLLKEFEDMLWSNLLEKDDIGLQDLVYDLGSKAGNNRAYFVSYYVQGDNTAVKDIKKILLYKEGILRYFIFSMTNTQIFHYLEKVSKELEDVIASWEWTKFGQKLLFFANDKNKSYISRKSLPMLQKYVTRFGNIKPRKYTNNPVNVQKKLRSVILRAREMWLVVYTKE